MNFCLFIFAASNIVKKSMIKSHQLLSEMQLINSELT